jgi:hypothetical protein
MGFFANRWLPTKILEPLHRSFLVVILLDDAGDHCEGVKVKELLARKKYSGLAGQVREDYVGAPKFDLVRSLNTQR